MKQKEEELTLAKLVAKEFKDYANGHKFNRNIQIVDTSSKKERETYEEIDSILTEYLNHKV